MNEIDIKIQQRKEDLKAVRADLERLEAEKKQKEEPKWIVAICDDHDPRIILNLAALSADAKFVLRKAIEKEAKWVSFGKGGFYGTRSNTNNGLTFYPKVKIVF